MKFVDLIYDVNLYSPYITVKPALKGTSIQQFTVYKGQSHFLINE